MVEFVEAVMRPQILVMALAAIAAFATVLTVAMPMLSQDRSKSRMKVMAVERDKMRSNRLTELGAKSQAKLRVAPKGFMQDIVEQFQLRKLLENEDLKDKLKMAGLRGQAPLVAYMFFRLVMPIIVGLVVLFYLFVIATYDYPAIVRVGVALVAGYIGFYLPNVFVENLISRRQQSIKEAFPDALDMLLICVQAGMSVEAAFGKVGKEIAHQSMELAEELTLTTAELSYLQERRMAFENLGKRTGVAGIKSVSTALIQAERYGTPVGQALRVMAKENRDMRMLEAEKKAAALPPKLTVPMIVFFLPVLFVVILGPAVLQIMKAS
jgi:tight adherence protein C